MHGLEAKGSVVVADRFEGPTRLALDFCGDEANQQAVDSEDGVIVPVKSAGVDHKSVIYAAAGYVLQPDRSRDVLIPDGRPYNSIDLSLHLDPESSFGRLV